MNKILVLAAVALLFVTATSIEAIAKEDKTTDTLKLKQGYRLHISAVDDNADPAEVCFHLTNSKGDIIDDVTVLDGDSFSLYDEQIKIVEVESVQVFFGINSCLIKLEDLVQYNKATGKIISEIDETFLMKPYN